MEVNNPEKYNRWYYRYDHIATLVEATEKLPRPCQVHIGKLLLNIVTMYQDILEKQTNVKSFGAEEIKSVMKSKKRQRWYDEIPELHRALTMMAILPEEVLNNINLRLTPLAGYFNNHPNLALRHPEIINREIDTYLAMKQFLKTR